MSKRIQQARTASVPKIIVGVLFCALMTATAGAAIFKDLQKLGAPFVCQAPYDADSRVATVYTAPGTTNNELLCISSDHVEKRASTPAALGIVFLYAVVVFGGLAFALIGVPRLLA